MPRTVVVVTELGPGPGAAAVVAVVLLLVSELRLPLMLEGVLGDPVDHWHPRATAYNIHDAVEQ